MAADPKSNTVAACVLFLVASCWSLQLLQPIQMSFQQPSMLSCLWSWTSNRSPWYTEEWNVFMCLLSFPVPQVMEKVGSAHSLWVEDNLCLILQVAVSIHATTAIHSCYALIKCKDFQWDFEYEKVRFLLRLTRLILSIWKNKADIYMQNIFKLFGLQKYHHLSYLYLCQFWSNTYCLSKTRRISASTEQRLTIPTSNNKYQCDCSQCFEQLGVASISTTLSVQEKKWQHNRQK